MGEIEAALLAQRRCRRGRCWCAMTGPDQQLVGYVVAGAAVDVGGSCELGAGRAAVVHGAASRMVLGCVPAERRRASWIVRRCRRRCSRRRCSVPRPRRSSRSSRGCSPRCSASTGSGLDDDFFALGGNSLLATAGGWLAWVQALDATIPVRVLFEASTVERLAVAVESHTGAGRVALVAAAAAGADPVVVGAAADVVPEPVRSGVGGLQHPGGDPADG